MPDRPSLEQLRKQAKEHLKDLRSADPSATLSVAQHALAREYGFESWPKLVQHVESVRPQPRSRMLQPAALKSDQVLQWSPGRGSDVWALFQACAAGDLPAVQTLVSKDPSEELLLSYGAKAVPERPPEDWPTRAHNWLMIAPLHDAARRGDLTKAKQLLDDGADINARDEHLQSTPLAWAAKFGQLKMVKFLLKRGAPKRLPDDPEWATPHAWATRRGYPKIAKLLM